MEWPGRRSLSTCKCKWSSHKFSLTTQRNYFCHKHHTAHSTVQCRARLWPAPLASSQNGRGWTFGGNHQIASIFLLDTNSIWLILEGLKTGKEKALLTFPMSSVWMLSLQYLIWTKEPCVKVMDQTNLNSMKRSSKKGMTFTVKLSVIKLNPFYG